MKTKLIILSIALFGIIAACAEMNPHPMDMSQAVQNAKTKEDHISLAEHYEAEAKALNLKVSEHKKLLGQYQAKAYLYGRQASSFKDHCVWLINAYEKAAEVNSEMAKLHRELAKNVSQ